MHLNKSHRNSSHTSMLAVRNLAAAVAIAALVVGCGHSSSDSFATHAPSAPASTSSGSPSGTSTDGSDGQDGHSRPSDLEPSDDLRNEQSIEWTDYELVDEHTIRVFFLLGTPTYYGARTQVREDDTSISIEVIGGTLPQAPAQCIDIAVEASLLATVEDPVADRGIRQ